MEERTCPECGTVIKGRIDKKFCGDLCRNTFNNKINSDSNNYVRNINNTLRKNRRILEENLQGEKITVPRVRLTSKGFDFNYHTNVITTRNKDIYKFCYEYGYLPIGKDFVLIVKRKTESQDNK